MSTYASGEKAVRLVQLMTRLSSTAAGVTTRQMAEELGVVTRTVQRYVQMLRDQAGLDIEEKEGRLRLGKRSRLPAMQPDRYQATLLLVALRLLHRSRPDQDPALLGALGQLSRALQVPVVTRYLERTLSHAEQRPVNAERRRVERAVIDGFVESRAVEVAYVDSEGQASTRVVYPYFIEPAVEGRHLYVFCHDEQAREMRSLRLDRIRDARLLPNTFQPPGGFDIDEALEGAWGIWQGAPNDEVVLLFRPEAAQLVAEERGGHPSATLSELPDGRIELRLRVASEIEMRPWVLRWGPLVEVVSPPSLRAHVAGAHARAAAQYAEDA